MSEKFVCRNGTNTAGVNVEFPEGKTEITRQAPCEGCIWRSVVSFERKPELEKVIDLTTLSQEQVKAYFVYQDARQEAEKQATGGNGGIFSWEQLVITRFPNRDNAIACWVAQK